MFVLIWCITNYDFISTESAFRTFGTHFVCDPANIVGRITLVRLGEIMLGCASSDEVELYFERNIISPNLTLPELCDP